MIALLFTVASAVSLLCGYLIAICNVTGWSFSWSARYGIARAMRSKDMMAFYEGAAKNERELFALHFMNALKETGGPGAHLPQSQASINNMFKLAEQRMNFDKKRRKVFILPWL